MHDRVLTQTRQGPFDRLGPFDHLGPFHRLGLLIVCAIAWGGAAGCSGLSATAIPATGAEAQDLRGTLSLSGSSTVAPLVVEIGRRFERLHPFVRVDVQTGGSSRGIRDALYSNVDVGMSSRALTEEESGRLKTRTIAWDGVAFVVHRDNAVVELTQEQLIAIYTGAADNWRDVGGADAPIVVAHRAEGRSELELITQHLGIDPTQVNADIIDGETQQTIKTITTNENAITYTSIGAAQHAAARGAPLKLLPLDGIPAESAAVQSGDFPVARPLLLLQRRGQPDALGDAFVRFAHSPAVADLVQSLGFVPAHDDGD